MKVSDIVTYIMKNMGFGFKKIRSSQDLEYSCT